MCIVYGSTYVCDVCIQVLVPQFGGTYILDP